MHLIFGIKKTPVDYEIHNINATATKLAIITDNTDYKTDVKEALLSNVDSACCVEVFGLEDIKGINVDDYDLVVIMAPVYAGRLQTDARKFIAKNKDNQNLILFMSAGLTENLSTDVDTIVSATMDFDTAKTPQLSVSDVVTSILEKLY